MQYLYEKLQRHNLVTTSFTDGRLGGLTCAFVILARIPAYLAYFRGRQGGQPTETYGKQRASDDESFSKEVSQIMQKLAAQCRIFAS